MAGAPWNCAQCITTHVHNQLLLADTQTERARSTNVNGAKLMLSGSDGTILRVHRNRIELSQLWTGEAYDDARNDGR
jgi:hypothetical protein